MCSLKIKSYRATISYKNIFQDRAGLHHKIEKNFMVEFHACLHSKLELHNIVVQKNPMLKQWEDILEFWTQVIQDRTFLDL